jgi:radical SAM-linked protein
VKVRIAYSKLGKVRFLGHLDMARLWERAFRKAGLPVAVSTGFTPRQKLSFGLALPTAAESLVELLEVTFDSTEIDTASLPNRLTPCLPDGIDVVGAAPVEAGSVSLQEDVTATTWVLSIDHPEQELRSRILDVMGAENCWLERERKGERRRDDVRPGLLGLEIASPECRESLPSEWKAATTGTLVEATLTTSGRGIRPTEVVEVLLPGVEPWDRLDRVLRTTQWIERPEATCAPFGVRIRKELDNERQLTGRERK